MFQQVAAIAYNTEVEKNFLKTTFPIRTIAEETVGCGVDLMQGESGEGEPATSREGGEDVDVLSQLRSRGLAFRRRHRLNGDFLLYGGRIDAGKGCEELLEYFTSYKEHGGDALLVLMGAKLMQLPEVPWVKFAGLLSERERLHALEAATIVVVPSPFESLSLLALEAMAVGTPVLCNGRSEVLVEHCLASNAGLYYTNNDEFVESATLLLADDRLRRAMGRNGREYVKRHYRWDIIMSKYDRLIGAVRGR
jgi:glycosyltransferase involved in cell wall biosynthesis